MQNPLLLTLFASRTVQSFCWMLVHSLWIGLIAVLLTGVTLVATVKSRPAVRHNLVTAIFALFLAGCGAAFVYELLSTGTTRTISVLPRYSSAEAPGLKPILQAFLNFYAANTPLILTAWTLLFFRKALLLTGALAYNQRLRRQSLPLNDLRWTELFANLKAKLGITESVRFVESSLVNIPVVIGYIKPVILLPVGVLAQLSPAAVEAVILHELAHIKRQDYLVNLCQLLAEAVFSFNPALLWLSAVLREEREHCCDDLAITTTQNKKGFVQALISFRERETPTYALAFPAGKNTLLKRVSRIAHGRNAPPDAAGKAFLIASFILLTILVKAYMDNMTPAIPKEHETAMVKAREANFSTVAPAAAAKKKNTTTGVKKSVKPRKRIKALKRDDPTSTAAESVPLSNSTTATGAVVPINTILAELQPGEKVHVRALKVNGRVWVKQVRDEPQTIPDDIQAQKDREPTILSEKY